jgi:hypothetical protein
MASTSDRDKISYRPASVQAERRELESRDGGRLQVTFRDEFSVSAGDTAAAAFASSPGVVLWNMDIRSSQELAWENKVGKGFNTTNIPLEFCLLQGQIAEAFDAWRKGRDDLAEELADAAIYLLGLAEMAGVNLQREIEAKLAKNAARVYQRQPDDALAKSTGEAD